LVKLPASGGTSVFRLAPRGLSSLELYLLDRLIRSGGADPRTAAQGRARLPIWGVGLLILGTAALSAAATWSLVAA
jgi:hypothetical protein